MEMKIEGFTKGDWVSFMRSGEIVYGQVEYIEKNWPRADQLVTTAGCVAPESVLEVRQAKVKELERDSE